MLELFAPMNDQATIAKACWDALAEASFSGRWCDGVVSAGGMLLREGEPISVAAWAAAMDGLQAAVDRAIVLAPLGRMLADTA